MLPPRPIAAYDVTRRVRDAGDRRRVARRSARSVSTMRAGSPYDACRQRDAGAQDAVRIEARVRRAAARSRCESAGRRRRAAAATAPLRRRSGRRAGDRGSCRRSTPRPPSRSPVCTSVRARRSAGASPQSDAADERERRPRSRAPSDRCAPVRAAARPAGSTRRPPTMNQCARSSPAPAAASASTTLSVSSCRTMRHWPAPSAERTAISRARAAPRASSRLATLPQAISSTTPDRREQHEQALPVVADEAIPERRRRVAQIAGVPAGNRAGAARPPPRAAAAPARAWRPRFSRP